MYSRSVTLIKYASVFRDLCRGCARFTAVVQFLILAQSRNEQSY